MDALTTDISTELAYKHRRDESTSAVQVDKEPGSDLETEIGEEDNNHTGTVLLQDSALLKTIRMEFGQVIFVWSQ